MISSLKPVVQLCEDFFGGVGDECAWAKHRVGAILFEELIILRRDNASHYDHNVLTADFLQLLHELNQQCLVSACK